MDKAVKIEKRDRRLLYELDRNARASYVEIAKRTGMSVDVVRYRTMRLQELGVIKVFTMIPNTAKLGFAFYKIFLKLHNAREADVQQMISYLSKHEAVCWVARTYGRFDLGVTVKVREIFDMGKLLDSILFRYSSFVRDRVFEVNLVGEYLTRDYFIRNTRRKPRGSIATAEHKPVQLDAVSFQILALLAEDSRAAASDIARKVDVSVDTVLHRIRAMERSGVIVRYNLVLNHEIMGRLFYKIMVHANYVSQERETEFLDYCRRKANIVFAIKCLAEWDYEFDIEVADFEEYQSLLMDLNREFPDIVRHIDGLMINKIHKYNLFPTHRSRKDIFLPSGALG